MKLRHSFPALALLLQTRASGSDANAQQRAIAAILALLYAAIFARKTHA
jgi:hypothetical protein